MLPVDMATVGISAARKPTQKNSRSYWIGLHGNWIKKMTQPDQDRIKLAEAMGWKCHYDASYECIGGHVGCNPPDPENDANDDYAVLEWARSGHRDDGKQYLTSDQFVEFDLALEMDAPKYLCDYETGDFARAALKALSDE